MLKTKFQKSKVNKMTDANLEKLVAQSTELENLQKKLGEIYHKRTLWYIWKNNPNDPRLKPYENIYRFE